MARVLLADESATGNGEYFADQQSPLEFVHSGCVLLDCVLGGGWPLGRVANLVGDSSSGKCARDFYVLTRRGLLHSDELGREFPVGVAPLDIDLAVHRHEMSRATHSYKEVVDKTIRFVTRRGFELIATPDHKVQVLRPNLSLEMVRMSDLRVDDQIVIVPQTGVFPEDDPTLDVSITRKVRTEEQISLPDRMTPSLAMLMGAFVADGSLLVPHVPSIAAHKKWKRVLLMRWIPEALGVPARFNDTLFRFNVQVSEVLPQLFGVDSLKGCTSAHKFVPLLIRQSSRVCQAAFLRALLSFDGYAGKNGSFSYMTASKRLARDVQMMLLNFDVVASLYEKAVRLDGWDEARIYHVLHLSGGELNLFLDKVGLCYDAVRAVGKNKTSNYDSIPYAADVLVAEIQRARSRLGWSANGKLRHGGRFPRSMAVMLNNSGHSGLSRSRLISELELLEGFIDGEFVSACDRLLELHCLFDPVVDIEEIDGDQTVIDVHVPGEHLFWCSGMISHNTLLAIEALANFHRKFPDGRMFYRESESAFDDSYARALGMPVADVEFIEPDKFATIEDFYDDLTKSVELCAKLGVPAFYVVDSLDALTSRDEVDRKFDEGSYETKKAKQLGKLFRMCTAAVGRTRMCLMIVSQTRDKIGVTFGGPQKTRSGGRALDFYASQILWLSQRDKVDETRDGVKRVTGVHVRAQMRKSKIALPYRECNFTIRFGHGVDSLASSLDWLEDIKQLSSVTDVSRRTYENRLDKMGDAEYWAETDRVNKEVIRLWRDIEAKFLQHGRPKYGENR